GVFRIGCHWQAFPVAPAHGASKTRVNALMLGTHISEAAGMGPPFGGGRQLVAWIERSEIRDGTRETPAFRYAQCGLRRDAGDRSARNGSKFLANGYIKTLRGQQRKQPPQLT